MIFIQDSVHGQIECSDEEKVIIDTPLFQRLRYVTQLAGSELVFPSCNHTRFSHCLGAMHIAGKYAEHLFNNELNKKYLISLTRIAALLHDIGHGNFSHAFDEIIYSKIYPGVEK